MMNFLGALGLSAGTSMLGGLINQSFTKDNMDYQNQLNQQNWTNSLLNGPLLQQQGYAKAGINPLLALGHSAESMAPVSLGQSQGVDGASIVNSALAAAKLEQEDKLVDSQVKLNEAKAEETGAHTEQLNLLNQAFPDKSKAELDKMNSEIKAINANIDHVKLNDYQQQQIKSLNEKYLKKYPNFTEFLRIIGEGDATRGLTNMIKAGYKGIRDVGSAVMWFKNIKGGVNQVKNAVGEWLAGLNNGRKVNLR